MRVMAYVNSAVMLFCKENNIPFQEKIIQVAKVCNAPPMFILISCYRVKLVMRSLRKSIPLDRCLLSSLTTALSSLRGTSVKLTANCTTSLTWIVQSYYLRYLAQSIALRTTNTPDPIARAKVDSVLDWHHTHTRYGAAMYA